MDTLVWLFIYLLFVIISTLLTSKKKPRKTVPPTTYRREPPIIIKPAPEKITKVSLNTPEPNTYTVDTTSTIDTTSEATEITVISTEAKKGGLLTALPWGKDSIISGIIFKEILGPPKSLQNKRRRF